MTDSQTEALIHSLSSDARAIRPLARPLVRATATLAGLALLSLIAILVLPNADPLKMRGAGGEWQAGLELATALLTGTLAVIAAFHVAIPGRRRGWLAVPLPALALWLAMSGLGCWRNLALDVNARWELGHSLDCLVFIVVASLVLGVPLSWRLSRARPIDPLPVAALAGLGVAALSAVLLQFFHPYAVTFVDLAVHVAAVLIVTALASLLRRPMLRPA